MPIENRFILMNKKSFDSALDGTLPDGGDLITDDTGQGQLKDESIVFIKDSKEIYTHGNLYKSVNWSVLKTPVTKIFVPASAFGDLETNNFSDAYGVRCDSVKNLKVKYADSSNSINENTAVLNIMYQDGSWGGVPIPISVIEESFPNSVNYETNEIDYLELITASVAEDPNLNACFIIGYTNSEGEFEACDTNIYVTFK